MSTLVTSILARSPLHARVLSLSAGYSLGAMLAGDARDAAIMLRAEYMRRVLDLTPAERVTRNLGESVLGGGA